jgi:hypothetical protein
MLLLLALMVGLLITGAAVYLPSCTRQSRSPWGVGTAVLSALAAVTGILARVLRR